MGAHELLLLAALVVPPVATGMSLAARTPEGGRRVLRAGCFLTAGAWAVLTALGPVTAGGFHTVPLLAAASCGAAMLAASVGEPPDLYSIAGCGLGLAALTGGLAAGTRNELGLLALAGLALAVGCTAIASWEPRSHQAGAAAVAGLAGVVAGAAGLFLVQRSTGDWAVLTVAPADIPRAAVACLMLAAAFLSVAGALRPRRSTCILVAAGLALGLLVAPVRDIAGGAVDAASASSGIVVIAVVLGVAAVVAAAGRQAALALALLGLAVAAGPLGLVAASRLLAAAAVIVLAVDTRPTWLVGVPGGVAVAVAAIELDSGAVVALALAVAAVAALLAWNASIPDDDAVWSGLDVGALPAAAAGAWLFVAPGSWDWVGPAGLGPYDLGAARAVASALIVVGLVVAWDVRKGGRSGSERPPKPPRRKEKPPRDKEPRPRREKAEPRVRPRAVARRSGGHGARGLP